jgi:hippurate hydrolase
MFQPGEEGYDGAAVMLEEGVLDAAGRRVDACYALHVMSAMLPRGTFATRPGPFLAAAGKLCVKVIGAGGHGSAPHRARDPIQATCAMVVALQTFVTRRFDVFDPVVISVGSISGGTAHNVIPENANFTATLRSFSGTAQARLLEESVRVVEATAQAHGVQVEVCAEELFPVTTNDPAHAEVAATVIRERFGEHRLLHLPHPLTGSEDFSRVLDMVPGAMVLLGAADGDPEIAPYNHSPHATFDESVLSDGAALYAQLALEHLGATA